MVEKRRSSQATNILELVVNILYKIEKKSPSLEVQHFNI